MNLYKTYALKLNEAYKAAFGEFKTLYDTMIDAEKNKETVFKSLAAYNNNEEADFKRREAARKARLATENFNGRCTAIWRNFNEQRSLIRTELEATMRAQNAANPDSIDPNGLELLKSGILTPDDMHALVNRYEGNPTMRRLIGKYARDAFENTRNPQDRQGYAVIFQTIANNDVMTKWESLEELADVCGGEYTSRLTPPNHVIHMGQQWDGLFSQTLEE